MIRLLIDQSNRLHEDVRAPDVLTEQFFREILLTYRLIFGQDERSHRAFSRSIPVWEEKQQQHSPTAEPPSTPSSWDGWWASDPMLLTLCGKSAITDPESTKIFDEIDATCHAGNLCYNANQEFPFFGKRLLELQQFVGHQQPQSVRALLNDRRDVKAWYTLMNNQVSLLETTQFFDPVSLPLNSVLFGLVRLLMMNYAIYSSS